MRFFLLLILIVSGISLAHADALPTGIHRIHGTLQWNAYELVSYNGTSYSWKTINLSWDNRNSLSASFCNTLSARVPQVREGYSRKIRAIGGGAISTLMYCDDEKLMKMENSFGSALGEGLTVSRTKQKITKDGVSDEKLIFRTKSWDVFVFRYMATFME